MKVLILLVAIFAVSIAIPIEQKQKDEQLTTPVWPPVKIIFSNVPRITVDVQKGKQLPPPPTWPSVKGVVDNPPTIAVGVPTFNPDIEAKKEDPVPTIPDDLPIDQDGYRSANQIIPDDFTDFPAIIDHN